MLKRTLAPVAWAVVAVLSSAAHAENLIEVYRAALQSDPTYLASDARVHSAEEGVVQARSILLPQLSASADVSRTDTADGSREFRATGTESTVDTTSDATSLSLKLGQQLYHHDSWIGYNQAQKRAEQSKIAHDGQLQSLIIRVSETYFNVLSARDGVQFAEAEMKSVGQQLEQTQQRFNVGLIAITDVHEAKARFDTAQANLIAAQNALDNANENLRLISGQYYASLKQLQPSLPLQSPEPAKIEDWVKSAQDGNLNLLAQRLGVEVARQEVKRQQAGHYPTLDAYAALTKRDSDIGYDIESPTDMLNTEGTTTTIGVTLTVPLFSGGRTSAASKAAEYSFIESSQNMEIAHRQAVRDARSAYHGVNAAIASVKAFSQAEISAQSALEATQAGFEVGTRTIVDVLQATSQLYNAKKNLSRARYDYVLNLLRLKAATGTLREDDLARVNTWLE